MSQFIEIETPYGRSVVSVDNISSFSLVPSELQIDYPTWIVFKQPIAVSMEHGLQEDVAIKMSYDELKSLLSDSRVAELSKQ